MLAGTVGKPIILGQTASQELQLVVKRCLTQEALAPVQAHTLEHPILTQASP